MERARDKFDPPMNEDEKSRLMLLATIEGNSKFWTREVAEKGAPEVLDRLIKNGYSPNSHSAEKIARHLSRISLNQIQDSMNGAFLITPKSPDWPQQLNELAAPPFGLIGLGKRRTLESIGASIGIVGTRNPTPYGSNVASNFAGSLAQNGFVIVSGGALGIDCCAHAGALAVDGLTVSVLASGVFKPYPARNRELFSRIVEGGLLLSEVLPMVDAVPYRFLIRNRLIAALGKGLLVIEAARRSGSVRTARDAAEIFRPVMAIPGPINTPTSEGCHRLINERRAELVSSVDEIMELVAPL